MDECNLLCTQSCLEQDVLLLASIWSCLEQDVLLLASKQWLKGVRSERGRRVERKDKVEKKWKRIAYTMKMLCARHLFMGTTFNTSSQNTLSLSSLEVVIGGFTHKKLTQTLHYCLPLNLDTTNPDGSPVRKLVFICTDLPLFVKFNSEPKIALPDTKTVKSECFQTKGQRGVSHENRLHLKRQLLQAANWCNEI